MAEGATTGQKRRRWATVEAPIIEELELPKRRQRMEDATSLPAEPVETWSTDKVVNFLRESGITEGGVLQSFHDHTIEGRHLADLDKMDLVDMGISAVGIQKDILAALKGITSQSTVHRGEEKVFNDPIHGHIELHPLMVKVIDTPQFQRLRYIKQLGGGYYVFPGASHNRFEHSIGVGHLAGELVETLQRKQPELNITDVEVLCVKLAGLCHDLGHGPFSHLFDGRFIPRVLPGIKWKHENASVMMFDHLIAENGLMEDMKKYGLDDKDMDFIKELLISQPLTEKSPSPSDSTWPYIGRPESKSFLYEIVANKKTGNDVDKWDYFARDCHCLGLRNSFDVKRHMKFARVINVGGKWQICTRDKEVSNLYEMFHTRNILHRRAYQHKTSNVFELMITEALIAANDYLMIPGKDNKGLKMSEAIWDPYAYAKLTDQIVQQIQFSTDPHLQKAKDIIEKVEKRQLYKYIGQTQQGASEVLTQDDVVRIASEIVGSLPADELDGLPELSEEDILVVIATFDYGMKDQNPIDHMRFYVKDNPKKAVRVRKDQVSQMLPPTFREQQIRVFSKKIDKWSIASARKYFINWCKKQSCITPKGAMDTELGDDTTPYNSPYATPLKQESSTEHLHHHSPSTWGDHIRKLF